MSSLLRPLCVDEIELALDPAWFPFESTETVPALEGIVAQPRAVRALELGLGIRGNGYNIIAVGLSGTDLPHLLSTFAASRLAKQPTPCDWVYVNNFDEPDRPLALALPAGQGVELRRDMRDLPQRLLQVLPRAIQYQGFDQEKQRLQRDYNAHCNELFQQIQEIGRQRDLHVELNPESNFVFAPLRDMQPMPPEEVALLPPEELEGFYQRQVDVLRDAQPILELQQAATLELNNAIRKIERTFAEAILTPLFEPLWDRYAVDKVRTWFDRVKQHMLDNIAPYFAPPPPPLPPGDPNAPPPPGPPPLPGGWDYEVNVMVDNGGRTGLPVLVEDVPSFRNLFGFVERTIDFNGRILTHFTQIKPGTLLRGNGGLVIFNLDDAIDEPLVWKELKRTLKNRRVQIDTYDPNVPLGASGMKPEPIPLDVKLIVAGSMNLFYYLSFMDPDFNELFKVKAEFAGEMPLDAESCLFYARLVRLLSEQEGLHPFDSGAMRELVRFGMRLLADRRELSADFSQIAGLAREADHWCNLESGRGQETAPQPVQVGARSPDHAQVGARSPDHAPIRVKAEHVRQALEERVYRSN